MPGELGNAFRTGRADNGRWNGGHDWNRAAHLLRRDWQIVPGAAACVAAGCHGGTDTCQRLDSCRDDGGCGRVSDRAGLSASGSEHGFRGGKHIGVDSCRLGGLNYRGICGLHRGGAD